MANAANHLGRWKELHERRQLGAPRTIGVEDHLFGVYGVVVVVKKSLQQFALLRFIYENGRLVASAHSALERHEKRADGTAHAGMKARVLP